MSVDQKKLEDECKKSIEVFKRDLGRLRSGRANTAILEGINVDYYGSSVPLVQLGNINAPEPRLITIQVYDAGAIDSVEKAIKQSDLGLNPSRDGSIIRLAIPALNEERRKELVKKLHKMAEETRVSIRNHRRDAIDAIKKGEKDKKLSADDSKRQQEVVQKVTDRYTKEVDDLLHTKEKEMMEV